ncbi:MOSC domain-containing protein [Williamsia sp. M5A3_1d]
MTTPHTGSVLAICGADRAVTLDRIGDSGIAKTPFTGAVSVTAEGVSGDLICDTKHHGGIDQAVYAYSDVEARRWAEELDRELPPGWFGENLRVDGVAASDAVIGERWRVGDTVELEVTIPRVPCRTFAAWAEEDRWIARFADRADVGAYLKVLVPGTITAGDTIVVLDRPDHGVTARALFTGEVSIDALEHLTNDPRYTGKVHREASKVLRRHTREAARARQ